MFENRAGRTPRGVIVTGICCLGAIAASQAVASGPEFVGPVVIDWVPEDTFYNHEIVHVDVPADADEAFVTTIAIEGVDRTIELYPHSLRSPDFVAMVPRNGGLVEIEAPAPRTMRGFVQDDPLSRVAASVHDGQMTATIALSDGTTWTIQPVTDFDAAAAARTHVVYRHDDAIPVDGVCGNVEPAGPDGAEVFGDPIAAGVEEATQIAIDADFEYYFRNGESVPATIVDIESVMNGVDAIYRNDTGICYEITIIIVRDAEPDPYSATESFALVSQFRNHWNQQQQQNRTDTMHLFTGKNIQGGVIGRAWAIGGICQLSNSYAFSAARFTGVYAVRVGLVCHEIGHLYNATHCDNDCNGCQDCRIMCPCINACCGDVSRFGTSRANQIINYRNSRTCLSECGGAVPVRCCFPDGSCQDLFQSECLVAGGSPGPNGSECDGSCPLPGRCCFEDGSCEVLPAGECEDQGGVPGPSDSECDGSCPLPPPDNDDCIDAIAVGEETVAFDTSGATDDGPNLPEDCDEGFGLSFVQDIWYSYQPTCDGTATVSLCGSSYDTRLAVYVQPGACPGSFFACNDDACGAGGTRSEVSFIAIPALTYWIRVGGFDTGGPGTMTVTCGDDPVCPEDFDGDGDVGFSDVLALLSEWGPCEGECPWDLDDDDVVGFGDLLQVLSVWGPCEG